MGSQPDRSAGQRALVERRPAMRAQQGRRAYQCAGLVYMHEFQFGQTQTYADRREINRLPARHAPRTGCRRQ